MAVRCKTTEELRKLGALRARAKESVTSWEADCGCLIECQKGEYVYVVPGRSGCYVEQGDRDGRCWHYCSDLEAELLNF